MTRILRLGLIGFAAVWTPFAALIVAEGASSADWSAVVLPALGALVAAALVARSGATLASLRALADQRAASAAERARA